MGYISSGGFSSFKKINREKKGHKFSVCLNSKYNQLYIKREN